MENQTLRPRVAPPERDPVHSSYPKVHRIWLLNGIQLSTRVYPLKLNLLWDGLMGLEVMYDPRRLSPRNQKMRLTMTRVNKTLWNLEVAVSPQTIHPALPFLDMLHRLHHVEHHPKNPLNHCSHYRVLSHLYYVQVVLPVIYILEHHHSLLLKKD